MAGQISRTGFAARRLAQAVPTMLGVTVLVFLMIHFVPGDPARALLGPRATPETIAALHREWGLDRPLHEQYLLFLERLVQGDLGRSLYYDAGVGALIGDRIGVTLLLLGMAALFTVLFTVPLAALAAARRDGWADHAVRSLPIIALGMAPVWVGVMLIQLFALQLPLFPVGGVGEGVGGRLHALVLPALTLAVAISPLTVRSLRSSMIDVLESDYVATARAKGLSNLAVIRKHVLRNAALPAITVLSINMGWLIGGSVVIERIFALPGLGQLMFDGILNRDFTLVQSLTLVLAFGVVLNNLLTDILYSVIDPRVAL